MKESRHDSHGTESPEIRKRRLARERQRRHREKVRAKLRQQNVTAAENQDNVTPTPVCSSQLQQDTRKRHDDDAVVVSERDRLQGKSFSQRGAYMDTSDLHSPLDVRERSSALPPKDSTRALKASSVHCSDPQKPTANRSSSLSKRSERPFYKKPGLHDDKQDRGDRRIIVAEQLPSTAPQKTHDRHQHLQQQHQGGQRHAQQIRHHQVGSLQQHQKPHQERRSHIRLRSIQADQTAQVPLLEQQRDHHPREQDRGKIDHRDQQQGPSRHEYSRHDVLHQQVQFPSNGHGYSAEMHQHHAPRSQHHQDPTFSFPQTDVGVSQQTYVPDRQYVPDAGIALGVATRTYPRFGMQGRSPMSNTAPGFATVQAAEQGLQNNLTSASTGVNIGVHGGLGVSRGAGITKYRQNGGNTVTGAQHASSQLVDSRDAGSSDPYAHSRVETPEERKRRLARERQRRRRKRLKQDSSFDRAKVEGRSVNRSEHEVTRDTLANSGVANAIDIPMHVRGPESNMQPSASPGIHASIPNFESPNLPSSHPLSGGVHTLQVPGPQEDLGGPGPSRAGFGTHSLGVPPSNAAAAATSGVLGHPNVEELHRIHSHTEEKVSRVQYAEDPETRKRRLARDRQRRRRERLKSRKMSVVDPNSANAHDLKNSGGATAKLGEGVDPRTHSDSERRVVASEGHGEPDRIPLGSAGSTVFGTRAEVAQSLTFGDQGRGLRGPSVPDGTVSGMPIGIPTGGMMNVSNVPANTVTLQLQNFVHWSQGFESEASAKFAVDSAIAGLQRQLPNNNSGARSYIIQQSIVTLLGTDDACRDLFNGPSIPSLRPDTVMRM